MATTTRSRRGRPDEPTEQQERRRGVAGAGRHPRSAAEKAARHNSSHLSLPVVGEVELPPADELAYLGGLAVLGALGTLEWPVVLLLAAGHALVSNRRNKVVREFGEALEEA